MKIVITLSVLYVCAALKIPFNSELNIHWTNFKKTFNKKYAANEEDARRLIWEQNVALIIKHNLEYDLGYHSYSFGVNEYIDMNHQEFVRRMNGLKKGNFTSRSEITFLPPENVELPSHVDWRNKGWVTPIKDQGLCGSCWAFSATGSVEGQHKRKTGKLVSLSEQNLVDCSGPEGDLGCLGGLPDYAFKYIKENGGIDTEYSYPYEAKDSKCRFNRKTVGATITGYVDILKGDEHALQQAVATIGPISVGIDARHISFQLYSGGIYDEPNCGNTERDLDHAVLVVGYGTEDGKDYWLVKNSWGEKWGMKGYIKMSRNKNNQCGIATAASYPLV